jgi:hypothetical protein
MFATMPGCRWCRAPAGARRRHRARRPQGLHVGRDADEIGIGQPQATARHRGDHLIEPIHAGRSWLRGDDAQRHRRHVRHQLRRSRSSSRQEVAQAPSCRRKACSNSRTAGPRTPTPVSRQGRHFACGSPSHFALMHTPERKPCVPSTTNCLRWSRLIQPSECPNCGGLKTRTWPPGLAQRLPERCPIGPGNPSSRDDRDEHAVTRPLDRAHRGTRARPRRRG